ncbi:MAG: alkaline phosphatase family protein, partial [Acidobacteriota bacterium]
REERRERRYSLQRIASAAGISDVPDTEGLPKPTNGKLVVLGLDGLSWNVLVPLLDAGKLPALSFLIRRGAFGYLDNGDQSLSPIVWTSIFTGRTPKNHGIDGYRKLNLPVSGRSALDLLLIPPSIDSFYGISHLLERLPSAGLWWFSHAGSNDRKAPALLEIASNFGRTVVVIDPLANLPVKPLNGAAIDFRRTKDPSIATCYPVDLSKRWEIRPIPLATGATDASYMSRPMQSLGASSRHTPTPPT